MPDHWSFSQFSTYFSCGEKYRLSYVEQVPRAPKGYFIGGNAIHRTIEESESTGWWGDVDNFIREGDALAFFHHTLEELYAKAIADGQEVTWGGKKSRAFPDGEDLRWWHGQGPSMLRRYASLRREDDEKRWGLPQTEVRVSMPGPYDRLILGYIDALFLPVEFDIGSTPGVVRDYKTGASYTPDHPLQLVGYARAVEALGLARITKGQFIYLRAGDGRLVYEVDLSQWFTLYDTLVQQWAEGIETGQFRYSPSWSCKSCDVATSCEVGRRIGGTDGEEAGSKPGDGAQAQAAPDRGRTGV